jgi:lipopolysaccharide heptosyltransferase II
VTGRLVVFAPNWLGDAVMALPAVADVRRALPAAVIDVAARPSIAPLLTLVPGIGSVVTLGKGRAAVESLRTGRYEAALLLPNSFNAARLAWSAGIPERWGYRSDFRSPLLTRAAWPPTRVHQAEYYRDLVRALGFTGEALADPRLELTPEHRAAGLALLASEGWDARRPLVAVAPGAAFGGAKRWPAASFAALVDGLTRDGVATVVIGTPADRLAATEMLAATTTSARPIDLIGRTDLPALAGVLVHCRALVTNDSGAMHLAAALGVAVTAMFGPTRERETHPLGSGHTVLTHPVWCRPCMLRECPLTHACMRGISVDAVLAATRARV